VGHVTRMLARASRWTGVLCGLCACATPGRAPSTGGSDAGAEPFPLPIVYRFEVEVAVGAFAPDSRVRHIIEEFVRRKNAANPVTGRQHLSVVLRTQTDWDYSSWQRPADLYIHGVDLLAYVDRIDENNRYRGWDVPHEAVCADLRELTTALGVPPPDLLRLR